ncbi:3'-5' exonuclease domain [Macleaya cordata]|uniref:3'-5' exonuclease domain n=1 Tax=Macleaya cordata TaxID=56857 RepID=A0A200R236_MACCD|nr:3'-5' exonuclease domain [Macleaya cordata]
MAEVKFEGLNFTTTVADSSLLVSSFLNELRSSLSVENTYIGRPVVGLHIESDTYSTKDMVATLQLCHGSRCIIIQLLHLDSIPQSLKTFLADPEICLVGICINDDIAKLRNDHGLECATGLDLAPLRDEVYPSPRYSLFNKPENLELAREFAAVSAPRPRNLSSSDWGARSLTLEQIKYSSMTAKFLFMSGSLFAIEN